jgi:hypothetical protein
MNNQEITYFEDLEITDCNCPHEDAVFPDGSQEFYRIVKCNPASSECLMSQRSKHPTKEYSDECTARAVSTFDSAEGLLNAFFKTPAGKKKERLLGKIVLNGGDGLIKQTFAEGHYSWWRSHSFDISSVTIQKVEV